MPIDYIPTPRVFDPAAPLIVSTSDLDDEAITRLGASLGVTRLEGEGPAAFRARVDKAFGDDSTVDAAVQSPAAPRPLVLGGMSLGDTKK